MRISDWSSDVCSSDLSDRHQPDIAAGDEVGAGETGGRAGAAQRDSTQHVDQPGFHRQAVVPGDACRSEEHTSELQSLMRISYAVFCLKQKKIVTKNYTNTQTTHY